MAVVKQIGELDAIQLSELNSVLLQSGYMVVENDNEANIVALSDLIEALGRNVEFNDLETASKEIINAINEINAFVYNYVWIGTRQEYEDLESYTDTFYLITDGSTGGDPILDNTAGVGVVDLDTDVSNISSYKMCNASELETVNAPHLFSLGEHTFSDCGYLYSVKTNEELVLNVETFLSCATLYKVCPKDVNYVGAVANIPFATVTLAYNPHHTTISYQTVSNYPFAEGDLVYNEEDSKLYVYDGSSWSEFVPQYPFSGGRRAFAGVPNLAVFPYKMIDVNTPSGGDYNRHATFNGCSLRNAYLDGDNFTPYNLGAIGEGMFDSATSLEKVWIVNGDTLSDDISLIFTSLSRGMFYNTPALKSMTLTNVTTIYKDAFKRSGIEKIIAPNVSIIDDDICLECPNITELVLGKISVLPRYLSASCPKLEKVVLGDGTGGLSFTDSNPRMFPDCPKLWSFTINTTTMAVALADERPGFINTPIRNFLGTTTTAITEGSTTTSIEINGSTVTAGNNNITTYGGKDWILTDGAWTEWGVDGNKHPCIKVPSALIASYKADTYWSLFNEELWTAI